MVEKELERIANALEALVLIFGKNGEQPPVPAGGAPTDDDDLGLEDNTEAEEALTIKKVLELTKAAAAKVGKEKVIALIKKFGVTKASDIPEEKFKKFVEALEKLK